MTQAASRRVRITKTIEFTSKDRTWSRLFREGAVERVMPEVYDFLKSRKACILARPRSEGHAEAEPAGDDDTPDAGDAGE